MRVLASRISRVRKARGYTQEDMAERTGISQKQMSRYERGTSEPTAEILGRLAQVLDVTTDYLLGLTDVPERPARGTGDLSPDERRVIESYRRISSDRRRLLNDVIGVFDHEEKSETMGDEQF